MPNEFIDHIVHRADVVDRLILVERLHFASQGGGEGSRIAGGSNHQPHEIPLRVLGVRNVDLHAALSGERTGLRVADHTDDFAHEFFIAAMPSKCSPDAEAFADRGCGRTEMTLRGGFVDDYHLRSVSIVARFEGASGKQRNLQRAKIIARDGGEHRVLRFVHRERPAFRNEPASNRVTRRVRAED